MIKTRRASAIAVAVGAAASACGLAASASATVPELPQQSVGGPLGTVYVTVYNELDRPLDTRIVEGEGPSSIPAKGKAYFKDEGGVLSNCVKFDIDRLWTKAPNDHCQMMVNNPLLAQMRSTIGYWWKANGKTHYRSIGEANWIWVKQRQTQSWVDGGYKYTVECSPTSMADPVYFTITIARNG